MQKSERTTERPSDARDPLLTEAAEFLTAHGRRREAITLVERVFRERRDQDTAFLLTLLLLGSDREDDSRLAQCYLRRLQWQPSPPPRALSD